MQLLRSLPLLAVALLPLRADVVETKNGARLVGTVTRVDGGNITLSTDYAGNLTIRQSEVVKMETSQPLVIRLAGGTTMEGVVTASADGKITIQGADGTISTTVDKVATTWAPGEKDPAMLQMLRSWKYEATFEVAGKSGNSEELGYGGGLKAVLEGPEDTLKFYGDFAYRKSDDKKSQDRVRVGVDYASYLSDRTTWYARDEGGYDNVKDITFYNVAASGFGYDFIKDLPKQKLTGRTGLSYRYEDYGAAGTDDVRSAGLDLGLAHIYRFNAAAMNNNITYVPSFEDFANYRAIHDSNVDFPLSGPWKFRVGVQHDYTSKPSQGVDRLDTTYYGRFVLNWE